MIERLKPYAEYKDSGLLWASRIPAHWSIIPNRAVLRKRKVLVGKKHKNYQLLSLTKGGVIVRDISTGKGKFSSDMGTSQEVRKGDFVFCLFDVPETPRTVGLSMHNGMITSAYTVFESPKLSADGVRYFERFYLAMDDQKLLSPLYSGLRHTIPPSRFLGTKTPQPPPDEQTAIVRFLDHANRKIDGFIRAKRKLIGLLNEQKQAIIHRAVTRGLHPDVPLKPSGLLWIDQIPAHWTMTPNRSLFRIRKVLVGARHKEFQVLSLTKRGVIVRDLDAGGKFFKEWERAQEVRAGDIVFCFFDVDETPRTIGLSPSPGMISPDYTVMECRDPLVASYLECYYLAMDDHKLLRPLYTGLRKRISKPLFLATKTPLPPRDEMQAILAHIKEAVVEIDRSLDVAAREIALMQEYRTRLTADLVTGKLDVREAAAKLPEPAAEEALEEVEAEETEIEEE